VTTRKAQMSSRSSTWVLVLAAAASLMAAVDAMVALADRIGERPLLVGGLALQAAGMAWIALIAEPGLAYGEMIAPLVVAGIGASMAIPPAASSVVGAVAQDEVGKAAGANSMLRELGGVFGIAILVAVFAGAGSYASAQAFSDGFAAAIEFPPRSHSRAR
jgi:MFS family permease